MRIIADAVVLETPQTFRRRYDPVPEPSATQLLEFFAHWDAGHKDALASLHEGQSVHVSLTTMSTEDVYSHPLAELQGEAPDHQLIVEPAADVDGTVTKITTDDREFVDSRDGLRMNQRWESVSVIVRIPRQSDLIDGSTIKAVTIETESIEA